MGGGGCSLSRVHILMLFQVYGAPVGTCLIWLLTSLYQSSVSYSSEIL